MGQYLELVAEDSYMRVNRKLVKLVGLQAAAYWSEILDIAPHVKKKKTNNSEGYWKLDRDYVEERTGISIEDQLTCDSLLTSLGILEEHPADPNMIGIKLEDYVSILVDDNIKQLNIVKKKVKVSKEQKARDKKNGIISTMKHLISEQDVELHAAYESWVDSVYASGKNFLTKQKIQLFEDAVNNYTSDKAVKLKILAEGIQTGYDRPDWVISKYESLNKKQTITHRGEQKISTGVNTEITF